MIKIGVQTAGPECAGLGVDDAYRIIADCGFDAVDANIDHLYSYGQISGREPMTCLEEGSPMSVFDPWKNAAAKYGLENYQAHAPFPSCVFDAPEFNGYMLGILKQCIRGCDYIGCRNLIIHPFFYGYEERETPEAEWETNINSYAALIPLAKEYGVRICLENMFDGHNGKIYASICSDIGEACRYVDTLNEIAGADCFGFCLDTGHLLLAGLDIKRSMIRLGSRIHAFHVHDNDGCDDQHLAPYMGCLDWNHFTQGLKAIGFDKTMCFETFNVWNRFDHEAAPAAMKLIAECGRMFARRAEQ